MGRSGENAPAGRDSVDLKTYQGLTNEEVLLSRQEKGSNALETSEKMNFGKQLLSNFGDPIIKVLILALVMNLLFTFRHFNWFESIGILMAIICATVVSTVSEYGSEMAFEKLRQQASDTTCRVIRSGKMQAVSASEIVCGDIVSLSAGERIPADGILLEGAFMVDQSALNGERDEIRKIPLPNRDRELSNPAALFSGTVITSGAGIMQVCSVGKETIYGSLAGSLEEQTRESPLKLRLKKLAKTISRIGYIAAAVVVIGYLFDVLVVESSFQVGLMLSKLSNLRFMGEILLHCLTLAVTIVVVAVPEGLPMMITVVLSANMKKMLKDHILVRKLVGIETAGSMNILFTDKTGTLTTGSMHVDRIITGDLKEYTQLEHLNQLVEDLKKQAYANSECQLLGGKWVGKNVTDRALASFAGGPNKEYTISQKIPFSSDLKYSAVEISEKSGLVYIKGAPELILPHVRAYKQIDGSIQPLASVEKIQGRIKQLASSCFRIVALAEGTQMPSGTQMGQLILTGILVLRDTIRKDARKSVEAIHRAGIQTVMVTGDYPETARAIALRCGILHENRNGLSGLLITSDQLSQMSDMQICKILPHLSVVARAMPDDKSRLVRIAQEMNLVVGMTGDGINDAPALKIADIGFAMGSGTEVAAEAADIVLMNDDFSYIVKTVLYGRTIFKSIRKFIIFQLTMNFCAVGVSLIGPFVGIDTPVTVVQMLWVNLIMDTLGGLAFAGEPPVSNSMEEPPKSREEPLVNRYMTNQILFLTSFSIGIALTFLKLPIIRSFFGYDQNPNAFLSAFFGLFIFLGIVNCFLARTPRINLGAHLTENKGFILIMTSVACIQLLMIYFGGTVFRTVPLRFSQLLFVFGMAILLIPVESFRRIFWRIKRGSYSGI